MIDPIDRAPFYHDGMRELQDRFDGRRVADALEKHRLHFEFWEQDRTLIEEARFFFIATSYQDNVDCSMRSGDPGLVKITAPDTLEYPEYDVRVKCEIFPNCPRYVPDLMGASEPVPENPFVPRPGYEPPPPEWKSRDYLKDVLSKYDPHRKHET